jgi:hypothetical protein
VREKSEALYGLRLANEAENSFNDWHKSHGSDVKTLLGHGLTIKVALGYKF